MYSITVPLVFGCALIKFTLSSWILRSTNSVNQVQIKNPLKCHKYAKTVTTNFPNKMTVSIQIIKKSHGILAAVHCIQYSDVSLRWVCESVCVCVCVSRVVKHFSFSSFSSTWHYDKLCILDYVVLLWGRGQILLLDIFYICASTENVLLINWDWLSWRWHSGLKC